MRSINQVRHFYVANTAAATVDKESAAGTIAVVNGSDSIVFKYMSPGGVVTSDEIKKDIETGQFKPGGKWRVYIYSLNEDNNGNKRIVFCDRPLEEMNATSNADNNTSNDTDNNHDNSDVIIDAVNDNSLVAHITQTETLQVNNLVAKIG